MPQFAFGQDNGVNTPKKILDVGDTPTYVALQVLDASTLHYGMSRETFIDSGIGAAAPNNVQGLQLKAAQGIVCFWMTGQLWGVSDTPNGLIVCEVLYQKKKSGGCGGDCGCGGGGKNPPEIP